MTDTNHNAQGAGLWAPDPVEATPANPATVAATTEATPATPANPATVTATTEATPANPANPATVAATTEANTANPATVAATTEATPPNPATPATVRMPRGTRNTRLALLALFALVMGFFAFSRIDAGRSSVAEPTDRELGALAVLAEELVTTSKSDGDALDAIGGYLPGTGIVLTVHLEDVDAPDMERWVRRHLDSYASDLAVLPEGESVVVTVDSAASRQARVWSLSPASIARADGSWDRLVAPATFAETRSEVAISSGTSAAATGDDGTAEVAASEAPPADDSAPATNEVAEEAAEQEVVESAPTDTSTDANAVSSTDNGTAGEPTDVSGGGGDAPADEGAEQAECVGAFADSGLWSPASGSWTLKDCVYSQTDATGFGYSTEYLGETASEYELSVSMRAPTGEMNGGVIIGQPERGRKHGARVIDITGEGTYLRWGEYDAETGEWGFIGGAPIEPALAPTDWTTLTIEVRSETTRLLLNGESIASIDPVVPNRHISLVSSVSNLEFTDFSLTGDAATASDISSDDTSSDDGTEPTADTEVETVRFDDELVDWNLLSGSWVASDGVLQQVNGDAYDQMTHLSKAPLSNYRVEVEIRALPDSPFSGGLLFDVQQVGLRSNSYVFDIVGDGETIRWARYDQNGVFSYGGGLFNDPEFDRDGWHTMAVEVREDRAEFFVDGEPVGAWPGTFGEGHVGVVTSLAAMEFRNFSVSSIG